MLTARIIEAGLGSAGSVALQLRLQQTLARIERSMVSIARSDRLVGEANRRLQLACNRIEVRAPAINDTQAVLIREACQARSDQQEIEREVRLTERDAAMVPAKALVLTGNPRA